MSLLNWQTGRRVDRDALRTFTCTRKRSKVKQVWGWSEGHEARHELVVQSMIRERLKPVGSPARTVLLGWSPSDDLGGVAAYRTLGQASFSIDVIAVAQQYRNRGGGWAREALSTTLDFLTADADSDGYTFAKVAATIHEDNRPSQRLFASQQFEHTDERPEGYQVWSAEFVVAGAFVDED